MEVWKDAQHHESTGQWKPKWQWPHTYQDSYYIIKKYRKVFLKMWRNWNPCTLLVGKQISAAIMENSIRDPTTIKKKKKQIAIWSSSLPSGNISKETKSLSATPWEHYSQKPSYENNLSLSWNECIKKKWYILHRYLIHQHSIGGKMS